MMKRYGSLIRYGGLALLILFTSQFAGCIVSRGFIFNAKKKNRRPKLAGKLIYIKNDGRRVYGFFSRRGSKLMVMFHGNRVPMYKEEKFARRFVRQGYSVLLVEYAGYGYARKYSPSESVVYRDSEAIIKYAQRRWRFSKKKTFAWGRSLGSGVATEMARRGLVSRMILVTPYTSIASVAEHKSVPLLPRLFIYDNFNTLCKAADLRLPVLLIHGRRDRLTPYSMSVSLKKEFPQAQLITLRRANHYNVFRHMGNRSWARVFRFLRD